MSSAPSIQLAGSGSTEEALRHGAATRGKQMWTYFGPAFVASVAYIDPGNFATNIQGGTQFGYRLLWVLLWSNAMAILIQYLSAKLGIVTGLTLPQNCRWSRLSWSSASWRSIWLGISGWNAGLLRWSE
jgi:manganese transport protein